MPLLKSEVVALSPDLIDLAEEILEAKKSDSSGGSRVTKSEAKQIAWQMLHLGMRLLKDIID